MFWGGLQGPGLFPPWVAWGRGLSGPMSGGFSTITLAALVRLVEGAGWGRRGASAVTQLEVAEATTAPWGAMGSHGERQVLDTC